MTTEINKHEPSGEVRGTAHGMIEWKGKQKRIAHAFLPTGSSVETVSVDLPKTLGLDELRTVARALLAFADAVEAA